MIHHLNLLPLAVCTTTLFGILTEAQVRMQRPRPLNGDMLSNQDPLGPGNPYPCQGYIASQSRDPTEQYIQGSHASIRLAGTAAGSGGSCQISLSYDNGTSFRVIESIIGGCSQNVDLGFTIPSTASVGKALLAWTWFNTIGNGEMHMNCAWVMIKAPSTELRHRRAVTEVTDPNVIVKDPHGNPAHYQRPARLHVRNHYRSHRRTHRVLHHRRDTSDFYKLPQIFTANIPQSDYKIDGSCDVVFPDPGPFVKYGTADASYCANGETGYSTISGPAKNSRDIYKRIAQMPTPIFPNATTTSISTTAFASNFTSTSTSQAIDTSISTTSSASDLDASTGSRATGASTSKSTSPTSFPSNSNATTTNGFTSTSTGTGIIESSSNAGAMTTDQATGTGPITTDSSSIFESMTTNQAAGTSSTSSTDFPQNSDATTTFRANNPSSANPDTSTSYISPYATVTTTVYVGGSSPSTSTSSPFHPSNSSMLQNSTMQPSPPYQTQPQEVSITLSRTTTHTSTFTAPPLTPSFPHAPLTSTHQPKTTAPTSPGREPGAADACNDFGSWRCDEGGHRLSRCNYAADWVSSHEYMWADMGVPPGTRCMLDSSGQPSFVYDGRL